jgi:hypothetical protein
MTARQLAYYLARIQDARTPPELQDIAEDAQREHPTDEATPRIVAMVEIKRERLVRGN